MSKIEFPKWNPTRLTKSRIFDNLSKESAFKYFRSSSSAFGKNKKVRLYLLEKFNGECSVCKSVDNLEVDHKISVFNCFFTSLIDYCNTEDNLQILCKRCNNYKSFRNG